MPGRKARKAKKKRKPGNHDESLSTTTTTTTATTTTTTTATTTAAAETCVPTELLKLESKELHECRAIVPLEMESTQPGVETLRASSSASEVLNMNNRPREVGAKSEKTPKENNDQSFSKSDKRNVEIISSEKLTMMSSDDAAHCQGTNCPPEKSILQEPLSDQTILKTSDNAFIVGKKREDFFRAMETQNVDMALHILKNAGVGSLHQEDLDWSLLKACFQGQKFLVQVLVRAGGNIHTRNAEGSTPFLICAEKGFTDIARFLVKKGADVNDTNDVGDTALILAIKPAGAMDMVRFLLEQEHISVHHQNQQGYTALMKAIEVRDVDTMKLLIEHRKVSYQHVVVNRSGETMQQRIADRVGMGNIVRLLNEVHDEDAFLRREEKDKDKLIIKAALAHDIESVNMITDSDFCELRHKKGHQYEHGSPVIPNLLNRLLQRSSTLQDADIKIIKTLLEGGADVNQRDSYENPPIITAIKLGSYELVQLLLDYGAHVDLTSRRDNKDPLMISSENGRCDLINLLIGFGAKVNQRHSFYGRKEFKYRHSPLDLALRNGHSECARLLLEKGAIMDIKDALSSAVECNSFPYLMFLFDNFKEASQSCLRERGNSLLVEAVRRGNVQIVCKLIDSGCNVNIESDRGTTPLMEAINAEMVNVLIKNGADVNQHVLTGLERETTALHVAIANYRHYESSRENVVTALLDNGAFIDDRNGEDYTPLLLLVQRKRNLNVLRILLSRGADVNITDGRGRTALMLAIFTNSKENAKFLIDFITDCGGDLNQQAGDGSTALMAAVKIRCSEIVSLLVAKGVDIHLQNTNGNTAVMYAASDYPKTEVFRLLMDNGANINHQNAQGESVLMKAAGDGNKDAIKLLISAGADINAVNEFKDITALSILFQKSLLNSNCIACITQLLEHGANASVLKGEDLVKVITEGHIHLVPKLISNGLGPADVQSNAGLLRGAGTMSISPLGVALLSGNVELAKYLNGNWFLTTTDVSSLARNEHIRQDLERQKNKDCLQFLDDVMSQPMPLLKLAFIAVSSAIGCVRGREDNVNSLPLPPLLKEKLLFKREDIALNVLEQEKKTLELSFVLRQMSIGSDVFLDDSYVYCTYGVSSDYGGYYDSDDS